ncbi:MAG: riboflavin biosynthesis protein RibF [Clostridia bacterium]|nr:riboflavin biosynthesis protein RibF [Clostridia bacterium]
MSFRYPEGTAVALGNFDGIHLGHRAIIEPCAEDAAKMGLTPLVWSFYRHPEELLRAGGAPGCLTPPEEKRERILKMGIREVILEEFVRFRDLSPEDFCKQVLRDTLNAKRVYCGFNFRFGKGGAGDAAFLKHCLAEMGLDTVVVPPVCIGNEAVSSTRIRGMLSEGRVEEAAALLGRPHSLTLPVSHGKKLGRKMGFATVNQVLPEGLATLKRGVYGVRCHTASGAFYGICNLGLRPTVDSDGRTVAETHLYDFDADLYGQTVTTEFCFFVRPEMRFDSLEALQIRIGQDTEFVRARWKEII